MDAATSTSGKEDLEDGHEARWAPASVWTPWRKRKSEAIIEELLFAWSWYTHLIHRAKEVV